MKKYYFIVCEVTRWGWSYTGTSTGMTKMNFQKLIDIHPIQWQSESNEKYGNERENSAGGGKSKENYYLLNWIEISKEEYESYKDQVG